MPGRNGSHTAAAVEEVRGIISLQLYDPRSCRRIIEHAEAVGRWAASSVADEEADDDDAGDGASSVRPEYRAASTFVPGGRSSLRREFDEKMKRVVKPLVKRAWLADLRKHRATHVVRYSPGGFYVTHSDIVPGADYRYFTLLCYLNDDFEGGRTSFPSLNHSVEPRAGKALLFPSTYLHRAEPLVSGEKYIIVTWLTGPPPIKWL